MPSAAPKSSARLVVLAGCLLAGLLLGCSGGKKVAATSATGELPDSEVEDFTVTETDSGRAEWTLFAKQAETYQARDRVIARTVRIFFFDETGARRSELVAREGELTQRSRDMIARGNVVLQTTEGWRMSTQEMRFLNSTHRIVSDSLVRVEKQGSILEGVGFESDPNLEHFEFRHAVRATVRPGAARIVAPGEHRGHDEHAPPGRAGDPGRGHGRPRRRGPRALLRQVARRAGRLAAGAPR
jgi:LPS export ABC transporter protein LptC